MSIRMGIAVAAGLLAVVGWRATPAPRCSRRRRRRSRRSHGRAAPRPSDLHHAERREGANYNVTARGPAVPTGKRSQGPGHHRQGEHLRRRGARQRQVGRREGQVPEKLTFPRSRRTRRRSRIAPQVMRAASRLAGVTGCCCPSRTASAVAPTAPARRARRAFRYRLQPFESKREINPEKRGFAVAGRSQITYMNRSTESPGYHPFGRRRKRQARGAFLGHPARVDHGRDEALVPRLRHERDRGACAARCARRPQAGAPAHPLFDARERAHARQEAREVGAHRRRRDGQISPARRPGDLRRAGAHGAGLLDAPAADRRAGQFRLGRRRSAGGDALHREPPDQGRDGAARGHRRGHGRFPGELRRQRDASRSSCRRASRTCWSTAPAASRSAWRPTSRRTISAKWSMPAWR